MRGSKVKTIRRFVRALRNISPTMQVLDERGSVVNTGFKRVVQETKKKVAGQHFRFVQRQDAGL